MSRIAIVLGSVTSPGRLHRAVHAAVQRTAGLGHDVDLIDLGAYRIDFADGRPAVDHKDDSAFVVDLVTKADAVIFASPVYRGTYTGALKNLLDWLPVESLRGKPAGILAMGATQHHYLGVDWHLRDVLAWFGALVLPTGVYLASEDFVDGVVSDAAAQRVDELFDSALRFAEIGVSNAGPLPLAAARSRG